MWTIVEIRLFKDRWHGDASEKTRCKDQSAGKVAYATTSPRVSPESLDFMLEPLPGDKNAIKSHLQRVLRYISSCWFPKIPVFGLKKIQEFLFTSICLGPGKWQGPQIFIGAIAHNKCQESFKKNTHFRRTSSQGNITWISTTTQKRQNWTFLYGHNQNTRTIKDEAYCEQKMDYWLPNGNCFSFPKLWSRPKVDYLFWLPT